MTTSQGNPPGQGRNRFPEVWGRVPPRHKNFTGRTDQLNELRAGLLNQVTAVVPTSEPIVPRTLHGYGGVGKTLMAVEYAHRFRDEYDLVWWVMADQPGLVRSSLAHLAPHLDLPGPAVTGVEEAANGVLEALRKGEPYLRWLLVFDNADEPEELNEVIPQGPGHVLITTRNHRWGGVAETVPVNVFAEHESVEFLKKRIPRGIDTQEAVELAEALGHLPLALEQAGALQSETGMSVQEYLTLLTERTGPLLREGKPPEYPQPMTAAWQLSVAKLQENLPEAMELLRCCAFFGPEPIPRDVFFPVEDGVVRPEMARLMADPIRLSKAIGQLGRYALVRLDNTSRTIQVHRLIQALVREELDEQTQESIRVEVWSLLSAAAPDSFTDTASHARYLELLSHLRPARVAESTIPDVREFGLDMLNFLYTSGDYETASLHALGFIERWSADSGEEDPYLLRAQAKYANRLRDLGRFTEAQDINRTILPRMTGILGATHPDTLSVLSGRGADYRARGDFWKAREHDEEVLRQYEDAFGPNDPATLRALNNLALDHALTSDFVAAQIKHERAYMLFKRIGPAGGSPVLLAYWNGLAQVVRLAGDYTEACDLGEDALAYGREQLGVDDPRTLRTQVDLAIARRLSGEVDEALELGQDAHSRYLRLYGIHHPSTLAAAMCLANLWRMTGELDGALELAEDTDVRYARAYGHDHPYKHGCTSNVALLYRLAGDPERARAMNEGALTALEARLGRNHHYTLAAATNLAGDLSALGDADNAVRLGQGSLRRYHELLGPDHPSSLGCASNLVLDLRTENKILEAKQLADPTYDSYVRTLGREHPFTTACEENRRLVADFDPPLL
ncbi:FxSxx-COOH system tetratricopeptide repeat protein [Nocardiopsis sp. MG754419]|uniref:FxSxx-COOH system tetratricopeptide repeat protein n=1 Tax=Nocardiopsis sp. MG754419 TaxID=2259865 RepID=UPI0027DB6C1A|nr:FxSxx-COOH system tetratricopeptide repeat protein [Nocardiopsis sp. MG754419]MBR8743011.1 cytochrome C [Nocardiopsis sp. MG754419]